jgi:hypothetical protein
LEGAEIAGSERETELADVGCERPLANLLRNPCGIWRAYESPVVRQVIYFQVFQGSRAKVSR